MAGSRWIVPTVQFMDGAGRPAVGFHLHSYQAGTSTPLATYSDAALGTPNTNPVVLDSNGYAGTVYTDPNTPYKFVLEDADGNVVWTQDNVYSGQGAGGVVTANLADSAVTTAKIADDNVTGAKLAAAVAGSGLVQDVNGNLDVNPDNSTIEINSDALRVKAGGATIAVSSNDTTLGRLNGKLVAGTGVTLTENNDAGNETLTVAATPVLPSGTPAGSTPGYARTLVYNEDIQVGDTITQGLAEDIAQSLNWILRSMPEYAAGDVVVLTDTTTVTGTTGSSYQKHSEIVIGRAGGLRVVFDLYDGGSGSAYGRLYKNGTEVGTERENTTNGWVTYSEDLTGLVPGDLLQVYARHTGGNTLAQTRNFSIRCTAATAPPQTLKTDYALT